MSKSGITIPFEGFYQSFMEQAIDYRDMSEDGVNWSFSGWRERIAKLAVASVAEELTMPLEYEGMWSPKEYNFVSDRVFVAKQPAMIDALQAFYAGLSAPARNEFKSNIADKFASRSGFVSFVPTELTCILVEGWHDAHISELISFMLLEKLGLDDINEYHQRFADSLAFQNLAFEILDAAQHEEA